MCTKQHIIDVCQVSYIFVKNTKLNLTQSVKFYMGRKGTNKYSRLKTPSNLWLKF